MNQKMLHLIFAMALIPASVAFALDPLGPPVAELGKSQGSVGIEYSYTEIDFEADIPGYGTIDIEDTELNKVYSRLGLGFGNVDLFLRLGVAELDVDGLSDSDYEFAIGGGTKITFYKEKKICWGMITQFIYYEPDYDTPFPSVTVDAEIFELQIALGPKLQIADNISVYGGPMFHYVDGDAEVKSSLGKADFDFDVDEQFGGYGGLQIDLDKKTDLNVEFQATGDGYCLGTQLIWRF